MKLNSYACLIALTSALAGTGCGADGLGDSADLASEAVVPLQKGATADAVPSQEGMQADPAVLDEMPPAASDASPPVRGTAFLRFGQSGMPQEVPYVVDGPWAVAQGDILLGTVDDVVAQSAHLRAQVSGKVSGPSSAMGIEDHGSLWDNATIPFALGGSLTTAQRDEIRLAMDHWERRTVVRFTEQTSCNLFSHCVTFERHTQNGGKCNSMVGPQSVLGVATRQTINVADWCLRGSLIHEIGHALGLYHEHTRADRDDFIHVETQNFNPDPDFAECPDNYEKDTDNGKKIGAYDFGSIMHYSQRSGCSAIDDASGARLDTFTFVQTPPAGTTVGQRSGLSDGDISAITEMYGSFVSRKYGLLGPALYGFPITAEGRSKDWGRYRNYSNAAIYWHPDTGAHVVRAEIRSKWEALNWENGVLGYPLTDTVQEPDGRLVNHFQGGSIYWRADTGYQVMVSDGTGSPHDLESGIKGHVDEISATAGVRGWAYDVHSSGQSIGVHIYFDGQAGVGTGIVTGSANQVRSDVNAAFGIWGNHGFQLAVPWQYYDGQPHTAYSYGLDVQNVTNPVIDGISHQFTFAGAEGHVEGVSSSGVVTGWALDLNSKGASIDVHYYIDGAAGSGKPGVAAPTNVTRSDINASFGASGNHGFSFMIPAQYQNGYQHKIYVYAIDAQGLHNPLLDGTFKTFTVGTAPEPDPGEPGEPPICNKKPWLCDPQ